MAQSKSDQIRALRERRYEESVVNIRECSVYRFFDSAGALLYVGRSVSPSKRKQGHKSKAWYELIARTEVQQFPSVALADEAERMAISSEHPLHNLRSLNESVAFARGVKAPGSECNAKRAARQAKWRKANEDLNRQRAREGMRKKRAQSSNACT